MSKFDHLLYRRVGAMGRCMLAISLAGLTAMGCAGAGAGDTPDQARLVADASTSADQATAADTIVASTDVNTAADVGVADSQLGDALAPDQPTATQPAAHYDFASNTMAACAQTITALAGAVVDVPLFATLRTEHLPQGWEGPQGWSYGLQVTDDDPDRTIARVTSITFTGTDAEVRYKAAGSGGFLFHRRTHTDDGAVGAVVLNLTKPFTQLPTSSARSISAFNVRVTVPDRLETKVTLKFKAGLVGGASQPVACVVTVDGKSIYPSLGTCTLTIRRQVP